MPPPKYAPARGQGQGPRTQAQVKKSSEKIFRRFQKKKSSEKFFGIFRKKRFSKKFSGALQTFNNSKNSAVLEDNF